MEDPRPESRKSQATAPDPPPAKDDEEHWETADVERNLAHFATRSGAFMFASQGIQFAAGLGAVMVFARLLTPVDFGIVAMAGALTGAILMIKDFGLVAATVQKASLNQGELSRLFWLNLKLDCVVVLLMAAMAPLLAWFFGEPDLIAITLVLTAGVFLSTLGNVHHGLLRRRMRFGTVALIEVASLVIGIAAGIVAAVRGASFWALVLQQAITLSLQGIGVLLASGWRPTLRVAKCDQAETGFRSLRAFARNVTLTKFLGYLSGDFYRIVVGRFAGAAELGLYSNAYRWANMAAWQLHMPLLGVVVSTFSRLQDEPERYRNYFRQVVSAVYALLIPTMVFLFIESREVILVLLGDQWLGAVPLFKILVLASLGFTSNRIAKWVYLSEGRPGRELRWNLVLAPVTIAGILAGLAWGPKGVALGYATAVWLLAYPSLRFCLATSPLRLGEVVSPALLPFGAAILAALLLIFLEPWLLRESPSFARLAAHGAVFGTAYLLLLSIANPAGLRNLATLSRIFSSKPT